MLIPRKHKHSRGHIRHEALRHEAKMMRLARIYGLDRLWARENVKRSPNLIFRGTPRSQWPERPYQEQKLDLQDQEDD